MNNIQKIKQSEAKIYNQGYRSSDIMLDKQVMQMILNDCNNWLDDKINQYDPGSHALVVGCGEGKDAFDLASRGFKVTAVDISETRIENAKQKAAKNGIQSCEFHTGDAEDLSIFADSTFDLILCRAILHHLPNFSAVIAQYPRILKHGGAVVVQEPGLLNPFAFIRRKFFPTGVHTPDEHPFVPYRFIELFGSGYSKVDSRLFCISNLLAPICAKLAGQKVGKSVALPLNMLDRTLTKVPWLRETAWIISVHAVK